jgi:hypothetical protein
MISNANNTAADNSSERKTSKFNWHGLFLGLYGGYREPCHIS